MPPVEADYGIIRREEARISILKSNPTLETETSSGVGFVLATRNTTSRGRVGGQNRTLGQQRSETSHRSIEKKTRLISGVPIAEGRNTQKVLASK